MYNCDAVPYGNMYFFFLQYGQITPALAVRVLVQFDKSINSALSNRVKSRVTFKAAKLNTYRFCDNVWTLMLNDVEFREVHEFAKVDKVKIVACDGKSKSLIVLIIEMTTILMKFILHSRCKRER